MKDKRENNDRDIDEIFEGFKEDKLKKAVRKAKFYSIVRNMIISIIVMCLMSVAVIYFGQAMAYKYGTPIQIAVSEFYYISAPNTYIGEVRRYHSLFGGRDEYATYKILKDKIVYTGEKSYVYGPFKSDYGDLIGTESPIIFGTSYYTDDLKYNKYNVLGQREMVFYYPYIKYQDYKNDLSLLDKIGPDKYMEMALSFDRAYSIDEVRKMIPEDVTVAWYWVDDQSDEEKEESKPRKIKQEGTGEIVDVPAKIRSERTAYGIKAYDETGKEIPDPVSRFVGALENGKEYDTRYKWEFTRVFTNIAGKDGKITESDIKVQGVVVTGDRDSLKSLYELSFIKASSLGVVTDKY
ncbi:MAG: anti sigma factor C-terminal domain-containing protein [Thermoanaerobacteraceae bacterium]|nr:anti sigma factor C-terminal domain-containing protein [Thermoanaerobacteraceae bacterium]